MAFSILLTVSGSLATLLGDHLSLSLTNRARVVGANLAEQQIALLRTSNLLDPKVGRSTVPVTLDKVAYTVTTDVRWITAGATAGSCSGGGAGGASKLAYLRADVSVSWPNAKAKPITMTSLITPEVKSANPGTIFVKVSSKPTAAKPVSSPQPGVDVTLAFPGGTSKTQITDSEGCAYFAFLRVGGANSNYTASVFKLGYTNTGGLTRPSQGMSLTNAAPSNSWSLNYG